MSEYTVYTENIDDHTKVHVIAHISDYFAANKLAHTCRGIVMYRDQFEARFQATSPNGYNGRF